MSEAPAPSPELQLLAACDLADEDRLKAVYAATLTSNFDWQRFQRLVSCQAMGGLVGARLMPAAGTVIPADVRDYLDERMRAHAVTSILNAAETVRAVETLEGAGLNTVVLKGAAIASKLYSPHPERRFSSDIDLLVDPHDLIAAEKALIGLGYRRTAPEGSIDGARGSMLLHMLNHLSFIHPELGTEIELHHRLLLNPYVLPVSFAEIEADACEFEVQGRRLIGLDGAILMSYLAWHALVHPGFKLKWFSDVLRAWRGVPTSQKAEMSRACRALGAERPFALASEVASRLYAHAIDVAGLPTIGNSGRAAGLVAGIISDIERAEDMPVERTFGGLGREARQLKFILGLSPRFQAKSFQLLRALSDPRDVALLGLGRDWFGVYAIFGPLLSLSRRLNRKKQHGS